MVFLPINNATDAFLPNKYYQRWSPRGRPWPRGRPRGHILKSLALASKIKFLALASKPQVLKIALFSARGQHIFLYR